MTRKILIIETCDDCTYLETSYDNCGDINNISCNKSNKPLTNNIFTSIPEWCTLETAQHE